MKILTCISLLILMALNGWSQPFEELLIQHGGSSVSTNYQTVILKDGPAAFYLFNQASGNITDLGSGANNITTTTGVTYGQTGLIFGSTNTSCSVAGTATLSLNNSAAWAEDYQSNFTVEICFKPGAVSGSETLMSKLNASYYGYEIDLNYNVGIGMRDGTAIPGWNTLRGYFGCTNAGYLDSYAACNMSNGINYDIVMEYSYTNGYPYDNFWVNGSQLPIAYSTNSGIAYTNWGPQATGALLARALASPAQSFSGTVQSVALYNYPLSEQQIVTHYLSYNNGQSFQPTSWLYGDMKGVDTGGNPLKISTGYYLWSAVSNLWYIYGMGYTGNDYKTGGGYYDETGVTNFYMYTSPNLSFGSFTSNGIIATGVQIPSVFDIESPKVVYNPWSNNYVMMGRSRTGTDGTSTGTTFWTAPTPAGPFSMVKTNINLTQFAANDQTIFLDKTGSNAYFLFSTPNGSSDAIEIAGLDTTFMNTNTLVYSITTNRLEAPCVFYRGTNYFVMESAVEYYQPIQSTNVYYQTCNTLPGTYTSWTQPALASAYTLCGTPYAIQMRNFIADPFVTNKFVGVGDIWFNGYLLRSQVGLFNLIFPTTNSVSFTPTNEIQFP